MTKKKTSKRKISKKRTTKRKITKKKSIRKSRDKKVVSITPVPEDSTGEMEVGRPSAWYRAVARSENVTNSYIWRIDKEKIYDNYNNKFYRYWDASGKPISSKEMPDKDHPGYKHVRQVMVLPDGKVITPIRQFCETKILPLGTREAFFYDFGAVAFNDVIEGTEPTVQVPVIRASKAETEPRGTRIDISYQDTEDNPIDIVASANRSFALESIHDENLEILERTFNDDTYSVGTTNIKHKGGGRKVWVDNHGNDIKSDDWMSDENNPLTLDAVQKAIIKIQNIGLDTSNAIFFTSARGMGQLANDSRIEDYGKYSLIESPQYIIEKILGIKIVVQKCPTTDTVKMVPIKESYWKRFKRVLLFRKQPMEAKGKIGTRSILFIPNVTFGLVSASHLTMEAQRRNEIQCITLTGTQKLSGVVKNVECAVRISHA